MINYLDVAGELKKTMEHECDGNINCNSCTQYIHQKIGIGTGGFWNKRTHVYHLNWSIVEIDQNTKKSPEESGEILSANATVNNSQKSKQLYGRFN